MSFVIRVASMILVMNVYPQLKRTRKVFANVLEKQYTHVKVRSVDHVMSTVLGVYHVS
jgi:hypothetical protein